MELAPNAPDPLAQLGEHARAFAQRAPREKAALLRAVLPRLAAAAPTLAALACQGRGVEPGSAEGALAWVACCVPLIASVRMLAESLEEIASRGRPVIGPLRRAKDGRARVRVRGRSLAERLGAGRTEVELRFEEGVTREGVEASQARAYRAVDPQGSVGSVASILGADLIGDGMPRALHALFVEGQVALVEADAASAALIPVLNEAFAPLVDAGLLALQTTGTASSSTRSNIVPWVIVPYLYAADELAFQARALASSLVLQRWLGDGAPHLLVIAEGWEQRALFLSLVEQALAGLSAWSGFSSRALEPAALAAAEGLDQSAPGTLPVIAISGCDPVDFVPSARSFANEQLGGGRGLTLTVHPSQEDDPQLAKGIEEALSGLRYGAIAVNAPASLIRLAPSLPWIVHPSVAASGGAAIHDARMVARVEKVLWRAPLFSPVKPAYFCDNRRALELGPRLARLAASPSLGGLAGLLGTLRRR